MSPVSTIVSVAHHLHPLKSLLHGILVLFLVELGRERERIDIISEAQAAIDTNGEDSACLSLLLELMLAEIQYFALGLLPETSELSQPWLLRRVRGLFWDGGVEPLPQPEHLLLALEEVPRGHPSDRIE